VSMPLVELDAHKICVRCGCSLGKAIAKFRPTDKNRFIYKLCDFCLQKLREERKRLGLEGGPLNLYPESNFLIDQGVPWASRLRKYVEFVDYFFPRIIISTLGDSLGPLNELAVLQSDAKRIVEGYRIITPGVPLIKYIEKFRFIVDKAEKRREKLARKFFAMRESGKAPTVETMVFELLFLDVYLSS